MAPIAPIQLANAASVAPASATGTDTVPVGSSGTMFKEMFDSAVKTVEGFQADASSAVEKLLSGQNEDVHTPIIATQKADLSFELFMGIRNKVISAYQSVMGMQL
jgi:flagellar hook-basal body complex protein FliE